MTSRMTATDELRRLLDERGVEWTANDGEYVKETCWTYMGELTAAFAEYNDGTTRFDCDTWCFTPEHAIEATLGRGECDAEVEVVEFSQMQEIHRFTCSECGESFGAEEHDGLFDLVLNKVKLPNYCPNCGRKVVD